MLVAGAVALGGCGGSSSSAEQTKLANQLSAQLKQANFPPDLIACVTRQARTLPVGQLRELVNANANPPPAAKQAGIQVITTCVRQGNGLSDFRRLFTGAVAGQMSSSALPADYTACVASKAGTVTPVQLSQFISAYVTGGAAAADALGRNLGVTFGKDCLATPGMLAALRARFLAPIKQQIQSTHFSAAFKTCFLNKASNIPSSLLRNFALHPASASAAGAAWGRQAADACIASGAKP